MFVSASTRCFAELDVWQALRQLMDLEFDKVEFWMDEESSHLRPSEVVGNAEEFASRVREESRLMPVAFTLAHDVKGSLFRELCKAAKLLRVTQLTVPASPAGTPFNSEVDRLKEFASIASGEGVRVAIKTESGTLSADPHTAVELCQTVKGLGLTFDPSYFLGHPLSESLYELVAPHTLHVHLRDSTPENLQVQVGLGEIDYSRLISQLEKEKYDRALSVDLFPDLISADQRPLELRKLRMLLDSLL